MAVPARDPRSRQQALEEAARARRQRSETKQALKSGAAGLDEVLRRAQDLDALRRMRVAELLASLPGYGPRRAQALMERIGIAANRRIGGLGPRQRTALIAAAEPRR